MVSCVELCKVYDDVVPRWVLSRDGPTARQLDEEWALGDVVGEGAFGTVKRCWRKGEERQGGEGVGWEGREGAGPFVCKTVLKKSLETLADAQALADEVGVLRELGRHPTLLALVEAYEDDVGVHMVMEGAEGGELFQSVLQNGHYSEASAARAMRGVLEAVAFLHGKHIVHRDLKAENFVLEAVKKKQEAGRKGPKASKKLFETVRLIDFGLAARFDPARVEAQDEFSQVGGSLYYCAPEVLRGSYGHKCDLWSVGVIMYTLLAGKPPFAGKRPSWIVDEVMYKDVDRLLRTDPLDRVSDSGRDLLRKLLERDPRARLNAEDALRHPWLLPPDAGGTAPVNLLEDSIVQSLRRVTAGTRLKHTVLHLLEAHLGREEHDRLLEDFQEADVRGVGFLDAGELQAFFAKRGEHKSVREIEHLMRTMDPAGTGRIDISSWIPAMMTRKYVKNELRSVFSLLAHDEERHTREGGPKAERVSRASLARFLEGEGVGHANVDGIWEELCNFQEKEEPFAPHEGRGEGITYATFKHFIMDRRVTLEDHDLHGLGRVNSKVLYA